MTPESSLRLVGWSHYAIGVSRLSVRLSVRPTGAPCQYFRVGGQGDKNRPTANVQFIYTCVIRIFFLEKLDLFQQAFSFLGERYYVTFTL